MRSHTLEAFGRLLSAVGVLNLLSDVLQLRSDLYGWINAYRRAVEWAGDLLFGWIDIWWLEVSALEVHALILSIIYLRSMFAFQGVSIGGRLTFWYISMLWPLVLLILLPELMGVAIVSTNSVVLVLRVFNIDLEVMYPSFVVKSGQYWTMVFSGLIPLIWVMIAWHGLRHGGLNFSFHDDDNLSEELKAAQLFEAVPAAGSVISTYNAAVSIGIRDFVRNLRDTVIIVAVVVITDELWLQNIQG